MEGTRGAFCRDASADCVIHNPHCCAGKFFTSIVSQRSVNKHQNLSLAASAADRGTVKAGRPGAGTISSFVFKHHSSCILGYLGYSVVGELIGTHRLFSYVRFSGPQTAGGSDSVRSLS